MLQCLLCIHVYRQWKFLGGLLANEEANRLSPWLKQKYLRTSNGATEVNRVKLRECHFCRLIDDVGGVASSLREMQSLVRIPLPYWRVDFPAQRRLTLTQYMLKKCIWIMEDIATIFSYFGANFTNLWKVTKVFANFHEVAYSQKISQVAQKVANFPQLPAENRSKCITVVERWHQDCVMSNRNRR